MLKNEMIIIKEHLLKNRNESEKIFIKLCEGNFEKYKIIDKIYSETVS
jgi:hypothetical protein